MLICYKLTTRALKFITRESSHKYPQETGGILIGKFDGDCVHIERATGPGPGAQHSPWSFRRDGNYNQKVLDKIVRESSGEYDYIGEWHSHPQKVAPSVKDIAAMHWIANNHKYAIEHPIMGLCMGNPVDTYRLYFYLFDGRRLRELKSYQE